MCRMALKNDTQYLVFADRKRSDQRESPPLIDAHHTCKLPYQENSTPGGGDVTRVGCSSRSVTVRNPGGSSVPFGSEWLRASSGENDSRNGRRESAGIRDSLLARHETTDDPSAACGRNQSWYSLFCRTEVSPRPVKYVNRCAEAIHLAIK